MPESRINNKNTLKATLLSYLFLITLPAEAGNNCGDALTPEQAADRAAKRAVETAVQNPDFTAVRGSTASRSKRRSLALLEVREKLANGQEYQAIQAWERNKAKLDEPARESLRHFIESNIEKLASLYPHFLIKVFQEKQYYQYQAPAAAKALIKASLRGIYEDMTQQAARSGRDHPSPTFRNQLRSNFPKETRRFLSLYGTFQDVKFFVRTGHKKGFLEQSDSLFPVFSQILERELTNTVHAEPLLELGFMTYWLHRENLPINPSTLQKASERLLELSRHSKLPVNQRQSALAILKLSPREEGFKWIDADLIEIMRQERIEEIRAATRRALESRQNVSVENLNLSSVFKAPHRYVGGEGFPYPHRKFPLPGHPKKDPQDLN